MMILPPRKLPIGIQDFEDLRINGYLYVDKTKYIHTLASIGKPYFLGRPRRFGKSLFLSTLKAFFEGKKELFEGLAIADLEKEWTKYPVFHLDFNVGLLTRAENVTERISVKIKELERLWGQTTDTKDLASRFESVIKSACEQTGKKVVVLIDEYDKPLINTINDQAANEEIRTLLKSFYGVLKSTDAYLRFVFLTGVTKFSQVSIFSDLNQLVDISLDENFSEICGISETELLQNFQPEIQALADKKEITYETALAEMKKRYDGYHFAKVSEDMYNPFSVLNTFFKCDFAYYWFQTGTPTVLVQAIKSADMDIRDFEDNITIDANSVSDYRTNGTTLVPLLYQSGYLTIKEYDKTYDEYVLGYPNEEVKYGFVKELLPAYVPNVNINHTFSASRFVKELTAGDIETFMYNLKAYYAGIPYDLLKKEDKDERYYQFVFYLLFTLMGQFVEVEVKSAVGRADAVVKLKDSIFIFEFKMANNGTAEDALAQINDKSYAIPYTADGRKLIKIGVEFDEEERGLKRWIVE